MTYCLATRLIKLTKGVLHVCRCGHSMVCFIDILTPNFDSYQCFGLKCYCTKQVVQTINGVELRHYIFNVHDCSSGLIVLIIANNWAIFLHFSFQNFFQLRILSIQIPRNLK